MRTPRILFSQKSWRCIEGGGIDAIGRYRGVEIQKKVAGVWKFMYFRTRPSEAEELVRKIITDGVVPR